MTEAQRHDRRRRTGDGTTAPGYAADHGRCSPAGQPVVLDGAIGTELPRIGASRSRASDERLWGTRSLIDDPDPVLDVHRRYVATGCDVISTNTWGLRVGARCRRPAAVGRRGRSPCTGWTSPAAGCGSPRQAVAEGGATALARSPSRSTATSTPPTAARRSACSRGCSPTSRAARPRPRRDALASCGRRCSTTVEALLDDRPAGLAVLPPLPPRPVRRLRRALGRPGGRRVRPRGAALRADGRRRAARQLHPARPRRGMVSYLRDFTDLPLGVYPNLGYFTDAGWRFDPGVGGDEYARDGAALARGGRADHRRLLRRRARPHRRRARAPRGHEAAATAAAARLADLDARRQRRARRPRRRRRGPTAASRRAVSRSRSPTSSSTRASAAAARRASWPGATSSARASAPTSAAWTSAAARASSASSSPSTAPSHVRAIDVDDRAVANTLTQRVPQRRRRPRHGARSSTCSRGCPRSATRSSSRASYQLPADPFERGRRATAPVDYWGRNARRPADRQAPRRARARGRRLHHAALDPLPAAHGRAARRGRASRRRGRRLRAVRLPARAVEDSGRRSSASRSSATPTTWHVGERTSSSPTCSRSRPRRRRRARRLPACGARAGGVASLMSADADEHQLSAARSTERLARLRVLEASGRRRAPGRAGPVSEIVDRAPAEAAAALGLDRVLLSRIDDGSARRRGAALRRATPATPRRRSRALQRDAGADRLPADRGRAAAPPPRPS